MGGKISITLASLLIGINLFGANNSYPYGFTEYNGNAYFFAYDENGTKLFKSDGTEAGTVAISGVLDDGNIYYPQNLTVFDNKLYFSAYDATNSFELWESDGTVNGTKIFKDLRTGEQASTPFDLVIFDNKLYFVARTSSGNSLWKSDGTDAGTTIVANSLAPSKLTPVGDKLFFSSGNTNGSNGYALFKSDGTNQTQLSNGFAYPSYLTAYKDKLYFQAGVSDDNYELWVSDGTEGGTKLFKDIFDGGSSYPSNFTVCGDLLYFAAYTDTNGYELWVTDGTDNNVTLVKDIYSGASNGIETDDGEFPKVCFNNKLYFGAKDTTNGMELWVTDGTEANTQMVKNIYDGNNGSYPSNFVVFDSKFYFAADDGINGKELWVSDGTEANTHIVKDIYSGSESSYPSNLTVIGDKLYFQAENSESGTELWISDGTEAGTKMLKDINYDNKKPTISNLSIDGTISIASKLIANYTYSDIESNDENTTLFLWYRADDSSGTNATALTLADGVYATGKTYKPTADDIGKYIKVRVAPMDSNYLKNSFMDEYGESYTTTNIKECLDDNKTICSSYDSGYTAIVPSKVDLTSVITANKWNMITVPNDINITASDIVGATIYEYDANSSSWQIPTTLTEYKGYWLYTSSTSGYDLITATKTVSDNSIMSYMVENKFSLVGNSQAYQQLLNLDYLPFGYFGQYMNSIYSQSNKVCSIQDFYFDSENDSWNTTDNIPYLGGFWVKVSHCISYTPQVD